MGAYNHERQQYHQSRVRDIMIMKPEAGAEIIQTELLASRIDPLKLDREYIRKLMRKIRRERLYRLDRAEIRDRVVVMRDTYDVVAREMWKILLDESLNYVKGGLAGRVQAARIIVDGQKNLLESEMNAGVFDRKLGTVKVEGEVDHVHRLDPELKAPIMTALEKYGLIKRPRIIEHKPEPLPEPQSGGGTMVSV